MKQQVLFCLLLTISAGTSHGHGVKGSFSNSYSSSSASSSASAFSSSYSSGGHANPDLLNEIYKSGNGAFSSASAHADANGASANSGAAAFSGPFSTSGAQAGHAVHLSSGGQTGTSTSGSFSSSGSYSGSTNGCTSGCNSNAGNSGVNYQLDVNGDSSNSEGKLIISGNKPAVPDLDLHGNAANSNSGSIQAQVPGTIPVIVTAPQNKHSGPTESKPQGTYFINDFRVPDEYSPNEGPHSGSRYDISKGGSVINLNSGSTAGHDQGGVIISKKPYQGPFPGPKGSIHDFKPAPAGGGGPPAWTPDQQRPVSSKPSYIHTGVNNQVHTGSGGISPDLIHSFPGAPGSIYDSKPATGIKPHIPSGNIPVVVAPVPTITQPHQKVEDKIIPGHGALAVIGKLPGSSGSIFTSVSASQGSHQQIGAGVLISVETPITDSYNKNPVSSNNNLDKFPINQEFGPGFVNLPLVPVSETVNRHSVTPDCGTGNCDEFGGRLGCHGNDCFGPGKKPSYVHSGSISGANANSNANIESGNFNIEFGKPIPAIYEGKVCSHGNCGGKQDTININCVNGKCQGNVPQGVSIQQPQPGVIAVGIVPDYKPINYNPQEHIPEVYPTPGRINFDTNKPVPEYQGTLCSGLECILSPIPGNKPIPGNTPTSGCSGAYCISIIPDKQENPGCQNGKCLNENVPLNNEKPNQQGNRNIYSGSESNAKAENNKNQENINLDIINRHEPPHIDLPIEVEIPVSPQNHKENSPKEPVPISGQVNGNQPGSSMDFLLPGNKPHQSYHPHINKPQVPPTPTQPTPSGGYYSCTGASCPLPKHPGQVTPSPTVQHPTTVNYHEKPFQPDNKPSCGNKPCGSLEPYPQFPEYQPNCNGKECSIPEPSDKPICIGGACVYNNQHQIPDEYKGAGGRDRIFVPEYTKEVSPIVIPVIVKGEPQEGHHSNFNAGSQANAAANSQNGFVSGSVIVEKPDGILVPVVDVQPPSISKPGYACSGPHCGSPKPIYTGPINSGSYSGSSGINFEGSNQGNLQYHNYPERIVPGSGCSSGNCGGHGDSQGSYTGSSGGHVQGNHGSGCSSGKCGQGFNGGQSGGYSGSGSYYGSGNFGGVKGGCKSGSCGFPSSGSGSYSGSYSSSSSFSGSGSGSYGGGVKGGPSSGSYSSAGSGAGFENGFPLLKELINQSIKGGDFHSGSGSFSGSSSYSSSAASSHASAYSSSGAYSA